MPIRRNRGIGEPPRGSQVVPPGRELTDDERQFITLYLHDGHATNAYYAAWPGECAELHVGQVRFRALQRLRDPFLVNECAKIRSEVCVGARSLEAYVDELDQLSNMARDMSDVKACAKLAELKAKALGYAPETKNPLPVEHNHTGRIEIVFVEPGQ